MTPKPLLRHRAQLACGGALAVVAIAGCGSSSSTSTSASANTGAPSGGARTVLSSKVTACLKQHGITLPNRGFGHARGSGGPPAGGAGYGGPPPGATGASRPPAGATGKAGKAGKARFGGHRPGAGFAGSSKMRAALKACGVGGSSSSSS